MAEHQNPSTMFVHTFLNTATFSTFLYSSHVHPLICGKTLRNLTKVRIIGRACLFFGVTAGTFFALEQAAKIQITSRDNTILNFFILSAVMIISVNSGWLLFPRNSVYREVLGFQKRDLLGLGLVFSAFKARKFSELN